jgi:hypothetical protein
VRSELDRVTGASLAPRRALSSYGAMTPAARRYGVAVVRIVEMLTFKDDALPTAVRKQALR